MHARCCMHAGAACRAEASLTVPWVLTELIEGVPMLPSSSTHFV